MTPGKTTEAFAQGSLDAKKLSYAQAVTQRHLLHRGASTHRSLYTKELTHTHRHFRLEMDP